MTGASNASVSGVSSAAFHAPHVSTPVAAAASVEEKRHACNSECPRTPAPPPCLPIM